MYTLIEGIPVWGDPQADAVKQIKNISRQAAQVGLMADHHKGYAMPIGGVAVYPDKVSPSGVGYDIACGNKAVRLDMNAADILPVIGEVMDEIWRSLSFGIGRKNRESVPPWSALENDPAWDIRAVAELRSLAYEQLGTIGSGNHFVDLFLDEEDRVWTGVHFGSRGFGHRIATHYIKAGGGKDGIDVDPVLFDTGNPLGQEYIAAMKLAGRYAYAGRDWVCARVAGILGRPVLEEVHNHHNFAWLETHTGLGEVWVVRKGATPLFPGQNGFIGGSMGDVSYIVEGRAVDGESDLSLHSTVHGAGRVMSRTQAAGKAKFVHGRKVRVTPGQVSREMMMDWVTQAGVVLRGADTDESPHVYKRLPEVIQNHANTRITHTLRPIGVAMAGDEFDPYKD
jgi:tRNA-splicing ligase RtcB